jgi:hypothetical protein
MKPVFFDTDVVSNWHRGNKKFELPLRLTLQELDAAGPHIRLMTTINWHEFLAWGVRERARETAEQFLRANFGPGPVMFDERAVAKALELQTTVAMPLKKGSDGKSLMTGGEYARAKDCWFRDIAMLGTALAQNAYAVVTCSGDLYRQYRMAMAPTKVILVEELTQVEPMQA